MGTTTNPPSPRPFSIKLIAVCYALMAVTEMFNLSKETSGLGGPVSGVWAIFAHLVSAFLLSYLGFGLWRLWGMARLAALGHQLYLLLSGVLLALNPLYKIQWAHWLIQEGRDPSAAMMLVDIALILGGIASATIGWFLIKHRKAFTDTKLNVLL